MIIGILRVHYPGKWWYEPTMREWLCENGLIVQATTDDKCRTVYRWWHDGKEVPELKLLPWKIRR